jgi:DNA-binding response OmpR family regulator
VADPVATTSGHIALVWSQDMMTQLLVSRVLEKQGLSVRTVASFQEFREVISSQSPHWLLLDAQLLAEDHLDSIKDLRGNARVIVLNAEAGQEFDAEFDAVLPQPVRPTDLRLILES